MDWKNAKNWVSRIFLMEYYKNLSTIGFPFMIDYELQKTPFIYSTAALF